MAAKPDDGGDCNMQLLDQIQTRQHEEQELTHAVRTLSKYKILIPDGLLQQLQTTQKETERLYNELNQILATLSKEYT